MSNATHTPAPWTFVPSKGPEDDMGGLMNADGEWICWFGDSTHYYPTEGEPPSEEDARLIVAAPDLLAVLQHIDAHGYTTGEDYDMVRAAIAKATGEQA